MKKNNKQETIKNILSLINMLTIRFGMIKAWIHDEKTMKAVVASYVAELKELEKQLKELEK